MNDFAMALRALQNGERVTRTAWENPEKYLTLEHKEATEEKEAHDVIYLHTPDADTAVFDDNEKDKQATDWQLLE